MPSIPHWRLILDHGAIQDAVLQHKHRGSGTQEDPYVAEWLLGDIRNPLNWTMSRKLGILIVLAMSSLSVAYSSSAYMSGAPQLEEEFQASLVVRPS